MADTLRELAAAALAEKLAAMTPEERIEHDDPDGSKRRAAAEQAAHAHAWEMFERSPLYEWFPTVRWGVDDWPDYPADSIVVYDTEERRIQSTAYFMVRWDEVETGAGPEVSFKITNTMASRDSSTGYRYWSTGAPELRSAAEVGVVLEQLAERVAAR